MAVTLTLPPHVAVTLTGALKSTSKDKLPRELQPLHLLAKQSPGATPKGRDLSKLFGKSLASPVGRLHVSPVSKVCTLMASK